jgi:ferritin-like metal-binding protein YciE
MAAKKEKTLTDLFEDGLKDVYYAEKKILAAFAAICSCAAARR